MPSTTWIDYVNELVNKTECIKRAAIVGHEDASMWACSEDFKPVGEDLQHLVHQFSNRVVPRIAHLEGVPFLVSRAHPTCIHGYKSTKCFHALKSNKVVLVVVTENEDGAEQSGFTAAQKLADYFKEQGF